MRGAGRPFRVGYLTVGPRMRVAARYVARMNKHGMRAPRAMAGWCFGLATILGVFGTIAGIAVGASGSTSEISAWPQGLALIFGSLFGAFLLACLGTLLRWAAALYEGLVEEDEPAAAQ